MYRKCMCNTNAEVAQLVERNLAKVEVESSRLFFRSRSSNISSGWIAKKSGNAAFFKSINALSMM